MMEIQEKYVQELITTGDGTEGQLLIPRKIHDTLIAEVDKKLLPRSLAAFYVGPGMIPGSSYDIDLEQENIMDVRLIAEGSEIILDEDAYESTNVKPLKYGVLRLLRKWKKIVSGHCFRETFKKQVRDLLRMKLV